jgi:hypothetical protein
MPRVRFEPMIHVFQLEKIFRALDGAATVRGRFNLKTYNTDVLKQHGAHRDKCTTEFRFLAAGQAFSSYNVLPQTSTKLPEEHVSIIIHDDDGSTSLRKVGVRLQDYTISEPRIPQPELQPLVFNLHLHFLQI